MNVKYKESFINDVTEKMRFLDPFLLYHKNFLQIYFFCMEVSHRGQKFFEGEVLKFFLYGREILGGGGLRFFY